MQSFALRRAVNRAVGPEVNVLIAQINLQLAGLTGIEVFMPSHRPLSACALQEFSAF